MFYDFIIADRLIQLTLCPSKLLPPLRSFVVLSKIMLAILWLWGADWKSRVTVIQSNGIFNSHLKTIIDFLHSLPSTIEFKLECALFYKFCAKISTFSIKKCSCWLLSTTFWRHARGRLTSPRMRRKYPERVKIAENLVGYARNQYSSHATREQLVYVRLVLCADSDLSKTENIIFKNKHLPEYGSLIDIHWKCHRNGFNYSIKRRKRGSIFQEPSPPCNFQYKSMETTGLY